MKIHFLNFFYLPRFIGTDIVQTMMSVSTLYLFPFSSYMQKKTYSVRAQLSILKTEFYLGISPHAVFLNINGLTLQKKLIWDIFTKQK